MIPNPSFLEFSVETLHQFFFGRNTLCVDFEEPLFPHATSPHSLFALDSFILGRFSLFRVFCPLSTFSFDVSSSFLDFYQLHTLLWLELF